MSWNLIAFSKSKWCNDISAHHAIDETIPTNKVSVNFIITYTIYLWLPLTLDRNYIADEREREREREREYQIADPCKENLNLEAHVEYQGYNCSI